MMNEEFGCAMQACRKVILHSSFLVLHFVKLLFIKQIIISNTKYKNESKT